MKTHIICRQVTYNGTLELLGVYQQNRAFHVKLEKEAKTTNEKLLNDKTIHSLQVFEVVIKDGKTTVSVIEDKHNAPPKLVELNLAAKPKAAAKKKPALAEEIDW